MTETYQPIRLAHKLLMRAARPEGGAQSAKDEGYHIE